MSEYSFITHEIKGYISSLFLIQHGNDFLLLDGGCSCDFKRVKAYLENIGKSLNDLKLVVITHMHPDHAGGVRHFKKAGIPVASTEGAYRWYRGIGGFLQHKIDTYLAQFSARKRNKKREDVSYWRIFKPDFLLKDGDKLPFFDDWEVISTPGHTLYDISLYNRRQGVLYVADLILNIDGKFVLPFPVLFPQLMKCSLEKIKSLEFNTILLAHGGVFDEIKEPEILSLIDTLKEKVGRVEKREFLLFLPLCTLVHDKWLFRDKKC